MWALYPHLCPQLLVFGYRITHPFLYNRCKFLKKQHVVWDIAAIDIIRLISAKVVQHVNYDLMINSSRCGKYIWVMYILRLLFQLPKCFCFFEMNTRVSHISGGRGYVNMYLWWTCLVCGLDTANTWLCFSPISLSDTLSFGSLILMIIWSSSASKIPFGVRPKICAIS